MSISNFCDDKQKAILLAKVLESTNTCATLTRRNSKEIQNWLDNNWLYCDMDSERLRGWVVREPLGNTLVEIKALYVIPEYRKKGVAGNLIQTVSKEGGWDYICATRTLETHNILIKNGSAQVQLLSLPIPILINYLKSRKFISIREFRGNKTTFWHKK